MGATGKTDSAALGKRFRISGCLVAPDLDELQRDGQRVRLEPKAMEVLAFLASRPGQVVSRDELLATVWPGVVVDDDALTQAVAKLRKALGDDARSPSYVETIAKRGYRLIARVDMLGDTPLKRKSPWTGVRLRWRAVGAGALLAAGIAVAYLLQAANEGRNKSAAVEADLVGSRGAHVSSALPTITVMPFDSLSLHSEHAELARGVVADLTTALSRLAELQLVGVARVADQAPSKDAPKLPSRYAVSGSVQRGTEQLIINAHLSDSETGQQLWSERYEIPLQNAFALQREIITRLVAALPVQVSNAERRRLASRHTGNLEAYDLFLRAKAALLTRQRADNEKARELYRHALKLDPTFARAYGGLALTYAADYRNQWTDDAPRTLARAAELAETAFGIDPHIVEVNWVMAYVHAQSRRHVQAMAHLRKAITVDPSFADAYALLGSVHTFIGQPQKAVAMLRAAARLHPERGYLYFLNLGRAYFFLGDIEQASINLRQALSRNAENLEAHVYLAATLVLAGDRHAAQWEAEEIRVLRPGFSVGRWLETYPMTDASQKHRLIGHLTELGLK